MHHICRTYSIVSSRVLIGMRSLERKSDEMLQIRELTTLAFQSAAQPELSTIGRPSGKYSRKTFIMMMFVHYKQADIENQTCYR